MRQLDRRRLLLSVVSSLLVGALARTAMARGLGKPGADDAPERALVASLFRSKRAAREVGRRYLADEPAEADRRFLLAAIPEAGGAGGPEALRRAISRRRERDFRDGDVVIIGGWVLARTEARLCAFLAIA